MYRLLVIKPSSLGDIVHGLQVVQAVKRARPDWQVTWVVRDRFAPLVQAAPCVHEVVIFRRRDGWRGFLRVLGELRRRHFDAVWDMQGLLRSGVMTAVARAPLKLGRPDAREGSGFFYNRRIAPPPGAGPHHALEILRPFLATAGLPPEIEGRLELREDRAFAWRPFFSGDPRRTFVIFTDSRGPEKSWPRFAEFMQGVLQQVPDSRIAWCAGQRAEPEFAVPAGRMLNLTGCPLDEMIALVRQRSVFVGNDSGPMHLAAACGNRVLALFGPTSPRRFGPYPPDSALHRVVVAPPGGLDRLEPAMVIEALRELCARPENGDDGP